MKLGAKVPAMCIASTITTTAIRKAFASIDFPPRSVVGESPMIPADAMGMDTFSLFKDIRKNLFESD